MELARFVHFAAWLNKDKNLAQLVRSIELFRRDDDDNWHPAVADGSIDDVAVEDLTKFMELPDKCWRRRNSSTAYFWIAEYEAVAKVQFSSPPAKKSQEKVFEQVSESRQHAEAAFDAVHDSLTGLLNSKGFNESARVMFDGQFTQVEDPESIAGPEKPPPIVALLALDIDHFKQVNDTFGHVYGDVVLQCLSRRLSTLAREIEVESGAEFKMCCARAGGEEFLVLICGTIAAEDLVNLGERIRTLISSTALPDEDEWSLIARGDAQKTQPPPVNTRRITVSIGIASIPLPSTGIALSTVQTLRAQADKALYSSKSGGRDRVRHFDEILRLYGHVLEHHSDTDLVAIDLGRQVNVALGQEFHVFHPLFDGQTDFVKSDGRSSRILGKYPRKSMGRIEVVEVQEEISFCRVAERMCTSLFPLGCHLEAIPVGSISHLVSATTFAGVAPGLNLASSTQLRNAISPNKDEDQQLAIAVFSINDVETLLKQRGTAFVNQSLAKLFGAIKNHFPATTLIGQVQDTEFAVVSTCNGDAEGIAADVVESASQECHTLATFSSGLFLDPASESEELRGDSSVLELEHALDYARYAALHARQTGASVSEFTVRAAIQIVQTARKQQLYKQATEDCKQFRSMGIHNAELENLAAVCEFALREKNKEQLFAAAVTATDLDGSDPVYLANKGVYHCHYQEWSDAHKCFSQAIAIYPEFFDRKYAMVPMAYSAYKQWLVDNTIPAQRVLDLLNDAGARGEFPSYGITSDAIQRAITDVQRRASESQAGNSVGVHSV